MSTNETTAPWWPPDMADTPITPVSGCDLHRPFPTSYCTACRAMFDAANPDWNGPYADEITGATNDA